MLRTTRSKAVLPSLLLFSAGFASVSCISTETEEDIAGAVESAPAEQEPAKEDAEEVDPDKISDLEHKLDIARAKLEVAQMENKAFERQHEINIAHAKEEVGMASSKLHNFASVKLPGKKASAELSLQVAVESADEAAEELLQLEIMYKEQDLHDMTREFVINRGKRRAERAKRRIKIQEKEFASLVDHELPLELQKLEIASQKAEEDLAKVTMDGEIARRGQAIKKLDAEGTVTRALRELNKAREGVEE